MIAWHERAQSDYIRRNVKMFQHRTNIWNSAWCFAYEDFGTLNGKWVRVHTLKKENTKKKKALACIFPYQICNFSFLTLPPIYSPYTRPMETILTNTASIERQMNRLSRDIYLDEYKSRIKEM